MATESVRPEGVVTHIVKLCEHYKLEYHISGRNYRLLPQIIKVKLPPRVPTQEAKIKAEEEIVQYCHDNGIHFEIISNSDKATIIPTEIAITAAPGDVKNIIPDRKPVYGAVSKAKSQRDFGLLVDTFILDMLKAAKPYLEMAQKQVVEKPKPIELEEDVWKDVPTKTQRKIARGKIPIPTFWNRVSKKIPFFKEWRQEKQEKARKAELEAIWKEMGICPDYFWLAGIEVKND